MRKDIALSVETLVLSDFISKLKSKLDDLTIEDNNKKSLIEFIDEQTLPATKVKKVINKSLTNESSTKRTIKEESRCTMKTKAGNPCKAPRTTDGKCWKHLSSEEQTNYINNKQTTSHHNNNNNKPSSPKKSKSTNTK